MYIKKQQIPLLIFNVVILVIFLFIFLARNNYEFLLYIGVIFVFLIIILLTNRKVDYPMFVLWGLSAWSLLHLIGGGIYMHGKKIYELMLIPIVGEPYNILK